MRKIVLLTSSFTLAALLGAGCGGDQQQGGAGTGGAGTGGAGTGGTGGAGAGGAGGSATFARICDGTRAVRLGGTVGGGGQITPGQAFLAERGFSLLEVRGDCSYRVSDSQEYGVVREGQLTSEQERSLSLDLHYGDFAALAGTPSTGGISDASTLVLTDGTSAINCLAGCSLDGVPPVYRAIAEAYSRWLRTLLAAGTPVTGAVKVLVIPAAGEWPSAWDAGALAWPLPTAPASDAPHQFDGMDATSLRALRQRYLDSTLIGSGIYFIPVITAGVRHEVYVRDEPATP